MWDFETEPEFQEKLDWAADFVHSEVAPVDALVVDPLNLADPIRQAIVPPLQRIVKTHGLWACHLGPELGGPGYGQLKLALLNEILGRSRCAPAVFGSQAPDSGNAEILAHYGSEELKPRYLRPLLDGEIVSCFSMTELQGGADPLVIETRAELDGDEWVINGEKWFSSGADRSQFIIVMAVTDPDNEPYHRMSMFVVPRETPGLTIIRNVRVAALGHPPTHAYLRYDDVRVPADHLLGARGNAFVVAQTRLGGGRIHHAMRAVGMAQSALDMMCERAVSRTTKGELLGRKQMVQEMIADSWTELEQFRLLVLRTAWRIDRYQDYKRVRADIAAVKAAMPKVVRRDRRARAAGARRARGLRRDALHGHDRPGVLVRPG